MRGSKRIGCAMRIKLRAVAATDPDHQWEVVWTRDGSHLHNHAPADDARIHVAHRQRSALSEAPTLVSNMAGFVAAQSAAGITVSSIHASILHGNADAMVTSKDIANAKNAARRRDLATQTSTEALLSMLSQHGFHFRYTVHDETRQLRHLFWAHPETTRWYKQHPDVLILDCTYKTNKYDMPLLNIVAMTGMNSILPVA